MKKPTPVISFNCVDKTLLSYEAAHQRLNFHIILSIEGQVDRDRLNRAFLHVLQRHSNLRTVLRTRLFRNFRHVEEISETRILEVCDSVYAGTEAEYEKCLSEWLNRPMDLKKGFPARLLLLKKDEATSTLIFTFHHSAIDGIRGVRFVYEAISNYENVPFKESKPLNNVLGGPEGDALVELARSERSESKRFYWHMLYYMFHFILSNAVLHPSRIFHDKSGKSPEIHFYSKRINPIEFQQIRAKSRALGGTVNDILLAACFKTIEKWNSLHGKKSRKISIMVPVDIAQEARRITTNRISFLSVSTFPEDRAETIGLLRRVNTQTASALRHCRGCTYSYVYFTYVLSHFPLSFMKAFAKYIKFPILADTVLYSNLGVLSLYDDEMAAAGQGSFRIVDFTGLGPVISVMGMFLCANTFNGSLGIDLCYHTSCFSKEKAQEFLNLYLDEIKSYSVELGAEREALTGASSVAGSPV
jgi:NRPS condensation-like uncharacterized protein